MPFCSQKILLMVLEAISSHEGKICHLTECIVVLCVIELSRNTNGVLVMMCHNITFDIAHDLKYKPVLFSSTLHFGSSLNWYLHVATIIILTSFMFCLPCILIFFVVKTNYIHYLASIYFVNQPLLVSGMFIAHHQGYSLYMYSCWYVLYV
jgi:hypothetical protein